MYEVENLLQRILDELKEMNLNINDMHNKLDSIQGFGLHNSIKDVCDKLDEVMDVLSDV